MDEDAKRNLRFMLATQPHLKDKTIEELHELFMWVVGKENKIVPVTKLVTQ